MNKRWLVFLPLLFFLMGASALAARGPSVLVRTASLKKAPLVDSLVGYGRVEADMRRTVNIGFPRSGEVARLLVSDGQVVAKGTPLLRFHTAPAASLAYEQAVSAVGYARAELKRTERLLAQHLATAAQLAAARKALSDARAALQAQRRLGTGRASQQVTAPFAGTVTRLQVQQGDLVQAGATVLQLTPEGALQADLGVEPEEAHRVKVGMPVRITSVFDASRQVEGRVFAVHGVINPKTRLVDVLVSLRGQSVTFLPGMQVRGAIVLKRESAWAVPRPAVLRDAKGAFIFQVDNGHARRVAVQTGIVSGELIGVRGSFDPQLPVVVLGNYELRDGMAVREETP